MCTRTESQTFPNPEKPGRVSMVFLCFPAAMSAINQWMAALACPRFLSFAHAHRHGAPQWPSRVKPILAGSGDVFCYHLEVSQTGTPKFSNLRSFSILKQLKPMVLGILHFNKPPFVGYPSSSATHTGDPQLYHQRVVLQPALRRI